MKQRRVAITGVGPVTAIGTGYDELRDSIAAARTGIAPVTLFDTGDMPPGRAAEIVGFDVEPYLHAPKAYLDRASELAFAALRLACDDAGLDRQALAGPEVGLVLGSAYGCLETASLFFDGLLEKGPRFVKPFLFPHTYPNTTISLLAIDYGLNGFHLNLASGSVSSALALVEGYDRIRTGEARVVLAGGYEAFSEPLFTGCSLAGILSPRDDGREHCAPFDRNRNGTVLGEGAGLVVLEDLDSGRARGAVIRGELTGAGACSDSSLAAANGGGTGITRALTLAAQGFEKGAAEIDYISAAANGGPAVDLCEARGIAGFLGERVGAVPVSSLKPMFGETLGAGGVLQLIAVLAAMELGLAPATLNLEEPDPATAGLRLVAGEGEKAAIEKALLTSFDPGGSIAALAVRKGAGQ